jgi:hypothetical protein
MVIIKTLLTTLALNVTILALVVLMLLNVLVAPTELVVHLDLSSMKDNVSQIVQLVITKMVLNVLSVTTTV